MTYFLFHYNKELNAFSRIVGPVFHDEIKIAAQTSFPDGYQVLEESVFANRFSQEYRNHTHMFWLDTMRVYCVTNRHWMGKSWNNAEAKGIASSWFSMYETVSKGRRSLKINVCITANRFHEAKIVQDIVGLFPMFDIILGYPYYIGNDDYTYVGTRAGVAFEDGSNDQNRGAYQRILAEKLCSHACLT